MPKTFARWQAARRCTGGAGDGAKALMAVLILFYGARGFRSWGIYNCRNTVLGNRSAHAEGRALDGGCSVQLGRQITRDLLELGPWRLGISCIIHDGRIYSAKSPRGRPYNGAPHRDHVHIEMTRKAAANLSVARARRILAEVAG